MAGAGPASIAESPGPRGAFSSEGGCVGPSPRRKARTRLSHFFGWTMDRNALVTVNPAAGIAAEGSASRERALTDDELRAVWLACDAMGNFGALVRTLILTLARRSEGSRMDRAELTPALWSTDRTKNGRLMDWYRTAQLNAILEPFIAKF